MQECAPRSNLGAGRSWPIGYLNAPRVVGKSLGFRWAEVRDVQPGHVPDLRCIKPVDLILELARRVRIPPGNTKEEHDAKGDQRDRVAGRAILEPGADER